MRAVQEFPEQEIDAFIAEHSLPVGYREQAQSWFLPLAWQLQDLARHSGGPVKIGLSGSQGSGKSTLAALLTRMLAIWGLRVASLSLDDFYLGRNRRQELADSVHPLLATRGVPGTHELELLVEVLNRLENAREQGAISIPAFDKSRDDRAAPLDWTAGRPDLILLEGWFVGVSPQAPEALDAPVNRLEAEEDPDGAWRRFVNSRLGEYHDRVFSKFDRLVFLRAPDFASVYRWRGLQERKLREKSAPDTGAGAGAIMNDAQLRRFISHYERLTRHALATLPDRADWMFVLDQAQQIVARVDRLVS